MKFNKLTPNLVVNDVSVSMKFYADVLGFKKAFTVPEAPPLIFGAMTNGSVEVFFNNRKAVEEDYPPLATRPAGGALTLFIEVEGIRDILKAVEKAKAKIVMPLKKQFYGMEEFAFEDPDGWIVTIAERVS